MKKITEELKSGKILVSDGAWGTFLQKKGLKTGECPESWCVTHRADVLDIAKSYITAGADMIETNSFGGTRFKLAHFGFSDTTVEINKAAASISREAAGPNKHVIASIGPTGKILMMGDVTEEQVYDVFAEQAKALESGGADACCIETMSALDEAVIAVKAAKKETKLEIICTFTFEKTVNNDYRTMMGVSPSDIVQPLIEAGADIIGTNCGNGMERMIDIVAEIRKINKTIPILVHANAGAPQMTDKGIVFPETPEMMAKLVPGLVKAGANIVGGCCGTTPEHITAIVKALKR
jgi:5-methyltetrahydrofolate--homocysteine methyltransferase